MLSHIWNIFTATSHNIPPKGKSAINSKLPFK